MRLAIALAFVLGACAPPTMPMSTSTTARGAVGVPVDGYPSYTERAMLVAINRTRSAPNDVAAGNSSDCSAQKMPTTPLMLDLNGSHGARFHAKNSTLNMGGLSHDSYCTLRQDVGTSGCDGAEACACEMDTACFSCTTLGGCGTPFYSRAALFGFSANGEVGAAGYSDGFSAVRGWVTECPPSDGHRQILTGDDKDVIGLGFADGGSCWGAFEFGDTGYQGIATAVLPSGVHVPETGGAGTTFDFYVNYFAAGAAQDVSVVIDGMCNTMSIELGAATNATYKTSLDVGAGCHEYYFLANDAAGNVSAYPESGAYGVGECSDFSVTRMEADCGNACPDADSDTFTVCDGDCNDNDPAVHPGAPELCNGTDDNCNATDDEGCACMDGETRSCGFNEGVCHLGTQTCTQGQWGDCIGGEVPDGGCGAFDGGDVSPIDGGAEQESDAGTTTIDPPGNALPAKGGGLHGSCGCDSTAHAEDPTWLFGLAVFWLLSHARKQSLHHHRSVARDR